MAVAVALLAAVAFAWFAGEQHRENCIQSGRENCTVLPWDSGDRPQLSDEQRKLLREAGR